VLEQRLTNSKVSLQLLRQLRVVHRYFRSANNVRSSSRSSSQKYHCFHQPCVDIHSHWSRSSVRALHYIVLVAWLQTGSLVYYSIMRPRLCTVWKQSAYCAQTYTTMWSCWKRIERRTPSSSVMCRILLSPAVAESRCPRFLPQIPFPGASGRRS